MKELSLNPARLEGETVQQYRERRAHNKRRVQRARLGYVRAAAPPKMGFKRLMALLLPPTLRGVFAKGGAR